jgi:hypothetical protein
VGGNNDAKVTSLWNRRRFEDDAELKTNKKA